jgi:hypothetical protein
VPGKMVVHHFRDSFVAVGDWFVASSRRIS